MSTTQNKDTDLLTEIATYLAVIAEHYQHTCSTCNPQLLVGEQADSEEETTDG